MCRMGLVYHLSTHDNGRATLGFAFEGVPTVSQRVTRAHLASVVLAMLLTVSADAVGLRLISSMRARRTKACPGSSPFAVARSNSLMLGRAWRLLLESAPPLGAGPTVWPRLARPML